MPPTRSTPSGTRRALLGQAARAALVLPALSGMTRAARPAIGTTDDEPAFRISLAQWSLHRMLHSGRLDALDFPGFAHEEFGIDAVEYVNQFFADRAGDFEWLEELRRRAHASGVTSLLIMIDGEGNLGEADDGRRRLAIENHFKWIAAAGFLGCHSIRVNVHGAGPRDEHSERAADSLRRLGRMGDDYDIDVLVENHGGPSSDGAWLAATLARADHPRVGALPDFGNFHVGNGVWYDRYQGVEELMPFARAVSAKSHDFDDAGNETRTDYRRMLRIVLAAGYRGYVGVEYEGSELSEVDGIRATQRHLEEIRGEQTR